jgi:hypothetical protein
MATPPFSDRLSNETSPNIFKMELNYMKYLKSLFYSLVMCTTSLFFACALIGVQPWNLY